MKKILCIVFLVFAFSIHAQNADFNQNSNFNIEANIGYTVGDSSGKYSFATTASGYYLKEVFDGSKFGGSISYVYYFAKEGGAPAVDSASFFPFSFAARFEILNDVTFGGDIGYAFGITPSVNKGGVFHRVMIGYDINDRIQFTVSTFGIAAKTNGFSNFSFGLMLAL